MDVEETSRKLRRNLMALAKRRFSPEEAEWLSQFEDPSEQHQRFMQLWTLKVKENSIDFQHSLLHECELVLMHLVLCRRLM